MAASSTRENLTAESVESQLRAAADEGESSKILRRMTDDETAVIGVRMATVFSIAKTHTGMALDEVERLLARNEYELRLAAVSVLDFKAQNRRITFNERRELYEVWMCNLDRINTWDYIDRSAPRVVGLYLTNRPRGVLFDLARSASLWHRRAAIVASFTLIRSGDLADPLALCEILAGDPERFVQTAVGTALREIGRVDRASLETFLERRGIDLSAEARRTARTAFPRL